MIREEIYGKRNLPTHPHQFFYFFSKRKVPDRWIRSRKIVCGAFRMSVFFKYATIFRILVRLIGISCRIAGRDMIDSLIFFLIHRPELWSGELLYILCSTPVDIFGQKWELFFECNSFLLLVAILRVCYLPATRRPLFLRSRCKAFRYI